MPSHVGSVLRPVQTYLEQMLDDILDMSFGLRDFPEAELSQVFLAYQVAFVASARLSWSNCQCVSWRP